MNNTLKCFIYDFDHDLFTKYVFLDCMLPARESMFYKHILLRSAYFFFSRVTFLYIIGNIHSLYISLLGLQRFRLKCAVCLIEGMLTLNAVYALMLFRLCFMYIINNNMFVVSYFAIYSIVWMLKAYMKNYTPMKTAVIFFLANLYLKQGVSLEYRPVMSANRDYKMKNSCPKWDSNPGASAYEANALSVELLELINIDHLKVIAFYLSLLSIVSRNAW